MDETQSSPADSPDTDGPFKGRKKSSTVEPDLAKAVGVRTIGVSWGVHSTERLQEREPTFFARNFDELEEYLLSVR